MSHNIPVSAAPLRGLPFGNADAFGNRSERYTPLVPMPKDTANGGIGPESKLGIQILDILTSLHYFRRTVPDADSEYENLRTMHFVQLLHDDMVLGLCSLDDDDNRSWGLVQVVRRLNKKATKSHDPTEVAAKITEFHQLVKPIRAHRDAYIAHYAKRDRTHLRVVDLKSAVRLAVEIADALMGEEVAYRLPGIDLRADVMD